LYALSIFLVHKYIYIFYKILKNTEAAPQITEMTM